MADDYGQTGNENSHSAEWEGGKNLRERKNALGYIAKKAAQCRFNHLLAFFFLDAAFFLGRSGFSSSFVSIR